MSIRDAGPIGVALAPFDSSLAIKCNYRREAALRSARTGPLRRWPPRPAPTWSRIRGSTQRSPIDELRADVAVDAQQRHGQPADGCGRPRAADAVLAVPSTLFVRSVHAARRR
jgi:hypothetical protein